MRNLKTVPTWSPDHVLPMVGRRWQNRKNLHGGTPAGVVKDHALGVHEVLNRVGGKFCTLASTNRKYFHGLDIGKILLLAKTWCAVRTPARDKS